MVFDNQGGFPKSCNWSKPLDISTFHHAISIVVIESACAHVGFSICQHQRAFCSARASPRVAGLRAMARYKPTNKHFVVKNGKCKRRKVHGRSLERLRRLSAAHRRRANVSRQSKQAKSFLPSDCKTSFSSSAITRDHGIRFALRELPLQSIFQREVAHKAS